MSDLKLSLLLIGLIVLCGAVLYRFVGQPAVPIALVAILNVIQTHRRQRRRQHFDALSELRVEDPATHQHLLQRIADRGIRTSVARALDEDGAVERSGNVETYRFPRSFVRSIQRRYWSSWAISTVTMGISAFAPDLGTLFRLVLLSVGVLCMVSVWRQGRNEQYLRAVIEVAPSHVAYVAHDGSRYTLPFYPKVTIESNAEGSDLVVRSQRRDGGLFISRHLIGFKRLRSLLYAYSGSTAPSDARPGKDEF